MTYTRTNIAPQNWAICACGVLSEDSILVVHGRREGCGAWDLQCAEHWDEGQKTPIHRANSSISAQSLVCWSASVLIFVVLHWSEMLLFVHVFASVSVACVCWSVTSLGTALTLLHCLRQDLVDSAAAHSRLACFLGVQLSPSPSLPQDFWDYWCMNYHG